MRVPTVVDVERIAALDDPVLRNLRITQCYHELSRAVSRRTGASANWCTFATWASRQAGQTIRGEDLARAVDDALGSPEVRQALERVLRLAAAHGGPVADRVRDAVRRTVDPLGAMRRASAAVATGNRKVFEEIGREFARWLADCPVEGGPDGPANAAFRGGLRDGDPPQGQRLLREAFSAYAAACAAADADAREEWLLLANLLVGFHEQTRLQPEIAASLDAAIDADTKRRLLALLLPGPWLRARAELSRRLGRPMPLDLAVDDLLAAVRRAMRRATTDLLMTLHLPGGEVLRLGRDVPGAPAPALRDVANPALRALLASADPRPADAAGSGADDWASLPQRMHFIAELFRRYQASPALFDAPFDAELTAAIETGQVAARLGRAAAT